MTSKRGSMRPHRRRWMSVILALAGCGVAGAEEIVVSAASSLTDAFKDVVVAYEERQPLAKVRLNLGASGMLVRQIEQGAPVDVLASADTESMDQAERLGLLRPETRRNFAANALVLAQKRTEPDPIAGIGQLVESRIARIALGQPALVPAGRYARQALVRANLWEPLQARFIYTQNVRQALDYLVRGEVDAAFIYATDLHVRPDDVIVAFEVAGTGDIHYPVALTASSDQPEAAQRFVEFLSGDEAQAILRRHGFRKP